MKLYETTIITDSQFDEAALEQQIKKIQDIITAGEGEIVDTQRWGLRRLAYEIQKKKQAVYTHFLYKAEHDIPAKLEAAFRVDERIMRFLTVCSQVVVSKPEEESPAAEQPTPAPEPEETVAAPEPKADVDDSTVTESTESPEKENE